MEMSLAEKIIRAEKTDELIRMRDGIIKAFGSLPNAVDIVDRDYAILKDELVKRKAL